MEHQEGDIGLGGRAASEESKENENDREELDTRADQTNAHVLKERKVLGGMLGTSNLGF